MNLLKSFWYFVTNCGINSFVSDSEIKRIKITNQLCLLAFGCYLLFDISFLIFQIPIFQFDYFITGLFFPGVLYLNHSGKNNAAKLLLCSILYFGIFIMLFFYGKTFETNLLLFPVLQVPFFIFDIKQRKFILITLVIPFLIFVGINLSGISNPAQFKISDTDIAIMRNMVQLSAVIVFFLVIYFYSRLNQKSEQSLTSMNSLLEEQVQTIFENSSDALLVIDTDHNLISNVNRFAVELFEGNDKEDLIGKQVPDLHKDKFNTEQLIVIRKNLKLRKYWNGEIEFETLKGRSFWGDLSVKRIETSLKPYQLVRVADVTQRKHHETQMQSSLKEKEILIDEIHHRVKNNLAIISSLLHLQSSQIEDKKLLEIFDESRRRIQSMALIHEKLYHNESLEKIDFSDYVIALVDSIKGSYNASDTSITVTTNIKNVHLELKHAIPCALILNELISNSYKHAFAGQEQGLIAIDIYKSGSQLSMTVKDNGIGMSEHTSITNSTSLGLTLVSSLVSQIRGNMVHQNSNGSSFQLTFNT
ncbi:MAG: PAS domain S-box protein [Bacteroidetes bacterium]|nr:PAS domain S-box protein [Bacteroidota bacterium]